MLTRLADAGFIAVSFDPPAHGKRGTVEPMESATSVFDAFRQRMWPLAGRFTLESLRVLDWVDATFSVGNLRVAGDFSMGGDAAVALAGVDTRISRVCALGSTPDWCRPGMRSFKEPYDIIKQGKADAYAQWLYAALNPSTHLDAYRRDVAISFQCGGADPADGARRFREALIGLDPAAADRVALDMHPGESHFDVVKSSAAADNALAWLTR